MPLAEIVTPSLVVATPERARDVFDTLTLAFAADPAARWMYPGASEYLRHFPAVAKALGGGALGLGTAFVNEDCSAVTLWLPPDAGPDEQALRNLINTTVTPDRKPVLHGVIEEMGRWHPTEPHWYLPFIGVDTARQGQGLGSALLRPMLAECDRAQLPAYLESTNPRNRSLYERHGFRAIGEIRVGAFPPIVPMLRQPAPQKPN